ncbi:hypothetical protein OSTOST_20534, partial [Ostertagia ostertagi]
GCASSDLAEGTSLIQIPSGSRRRKSRSFSVSSESSPKKLDRRRSKRFRTESDGALNLREALKLPLTRHVDAADTDARSFTAQSNRLQPSRSDDEMNTTPSHVDNSTTVLPNTAPAKTGGEVASPNSALK